MVPFRRRMSASQRLCATVASIAYRHRTLRNVITKVSTTELGAKQFMLKKIKI